MLKLCRVTNVKVLFLVLVYVFNFNLFEFRPPFWRTVYSCVMYNFYFLFLSFRERRTPFPVQGPNPIKEQGIVGHAHLLSPALPHQQLPRALGLFKLLPLGTSQVSPRCRCRGRNAVLFTLTECSVVLLRGTSKSLKKQSIWSSRLRNKVYVYVTHLKRAETYFWKILHKQTGTLQFPAPRHENAAYELSWK